LHKTATNQSSSQSVSQSVSQSSCWLTDADAGNIFCQLHPLAELLLNYVRVNCCGGRWRGVCCWKRFSVCTKCNSPANDAFH